MEVFKIMGKSDNKVMSTNKAMKHDKKAYQQNGRSHALHS